MSRKPTYYIGIDEAGRGPLAGPVTVGVVKIPNDFDWEMIPGVTDSKKLSPEKRAEIFARAKELRHKRMLDFAVAQVGASVIDNRGIIHAIRLATNRCIARLQLRPEQVTIRLDGSLSAPEEYKQATIIKGDALYPEIGLASIVAKETRDAYMTRIARRFFRYGFEEHKGYGTKAHRQAIKQYGLSPIHRVSYCQNCQS
jgi:ribonuclease HII